MTRTVVASVESEYRRYKRLGDESLRQLDGDALTRHPPGDGNSVAMLVWHLSGNLRSRFTDFLTTDGEKPDRDRDSEFEQLDADTKEALLARWETGWGLLFDAIGPLTEDDLQKTVAIRGEPHTVLQAINRQLTHYASHVGQIVFLAKHLAGPRWQSLSIPRGKSRQFDVTKEGTPYRP